MTRFFASLRCLIFLSLPALTALRAVADDRVISQYADAVDRLHANAVRLADRSAAQGNPETADEIRRWLANRTTRGLTFPVLSMNGDPVPSAAGRAKAEWFELREGAAKEVFELAADAFRERRVAFSYELVRDTVELDPNHGAARALLGYTRRGDRWVTPFTAQKLASGQTWSRRFGWVTKNQLTRLEAGERLWKGQWLPDAEVAKYRAVWSNAWEIETEHYVVRTNADLERGVELAENLEQLYAVFFRLFAGYFTPREQVAALFDNVGRRTPGGKSAEPRRRTAERFRVHFYRTRDDYMEALRSHIRTGLDVSTGMYLPKTRTAYFFMSDNPAQATDVATVLHEGTHQLFVETRSGITLSANPVHYWAMEGISCYMESLVQSGDRVELGSWRTPRLAVGRKRIVDAKQYVPLDRLVRLTPKEFDGPQIYALYTQSACVCHFLMHHEGGRFRDVLVQFLESIYTGKADANTLATLTGLSYAELDELILQHVAAGAL